MSEGPANGDVHRLNQRPDYQRVRDASVRGAGVGVAAVGSRVLLRVSSLVVLARLLTPADFGVVAMAAPLLTLFTLAADWGLTMATTQRQHIDQEQLSALFWINAGAGLILAALMAALSPLLVLIFNEPRLIGISMVMSLTLVAIGLGAQHEALLRRRLRYGSLHGCGIVASAVGLVVAIVAALGGIGVWSLVWSQVVSQVSRTAMLWMAARWKPTRPSGRVNIGPFLRFGNRLAPANLLFHLSRRFDGVLIGAVAGASELGIYRRAHGMVSEPLEQMIQPMHRIVPASLSRLQDDVHQFSRFYLHGFAMFSLVGWSVIGLAAAEAPAVVNLVLGDQWLAAVPLLRWLAPGVLVSLLGATATDWVLTPRGDVKSLLAVRAVRLGSIIAGVLVGWRLGGVMGVAAGYSAASVVTLVIEMRYATAGTGVRAGDLIAALLRPMVAAAGAATVMVLIATDGSVVTLLLESGLYLVVFLGVHAALPGGWQVIQRTLRAMRKAVHLQPVAS